MDIKFYFYTTNPEHSVEVDGNIIFNGNIATIPISSELFNDLDDGVISYLAKGVLNDEPFVFERQSNYYLKTPSSARKVEVQPLKELVIIENGEYTIIPDDGYISIGEVKLNVNIEDTNGSYEEGYNDGIEEGINNAGEIIAETAQVLNITENGNYLTQYSETIIPEQITGYLEDGTPFYSYAELNNIVFDTGIKVTQNTKVELWWSPEKIESADKCIIGSQCIVNDIFKIGTRDTRQGLSAEIAGEDINYSDLEVGKWYHIEMSFADGYFVNGVKIGDFEINVDETYTRNLLINNYYWYQTLEAKCINGKFGMIKVNGNIILPKAEGFYDTTKNEYLSIILPGNYDFVEQSIIQGEGNLIKSVNVNVSPKINIAKYDIKFGRSTFNEIPEWVYFDGGINLESMFVECVNLVDFTFLETWKYPIYANMSKMFESIPNIQKCPALYIEGNTTYYQSCPFYSFSDLTNFTDFGGFVGLKYSMTTNYGLAKCPNLSYESCINVLNGLYDFTGNGETPNSSQGQLKVHQNFINKVDAEINIAINKGWIITA